MASAFSFTERITACDLCGGTRLSTLSVEADMVECLACGYRFVSPRPSQAEIASSYSEPDFYDEWIEAEPGRRRMWSKRLGLLKRAGRNVRVLDIGAGIGSFLSIARDQLGWEVVGTEVSTAGARVARERYGLELHLGPVDDLPLSAGSFDLVTLWHVLEHVPFPGKTLNLCHTLLATGGRLAIAIPNDEDERWWLVRAKARLRREKPPPRYVALSPHEEVHLSQFTTAVLGSALRSRGFRVELTTVDDQYANPTMRSETLIEAYRLIHRLTGLNLGQASFVLARKVVAPTAGLRPNHRLSLLRWRERH